RRSTPDRLYQAGRAGTVRRLTLEGELPDRAEALVAASEARAADDGFERDGRWWDAGRQWIVESALAGGPRHAAASVSSGSSRIRREGGYGPPPSGRRNNTAADGDQGSINAP